MSQALFSTRFKKIMNSSHESLAFASFKFAKSTRTKVDTGEVEFSEYSPTGKRRMRHARIIYVRARSAVSISNRAIARKARARTELEQGRVRAGQRDSDVPSDVERLTYRSVTDNLSSFLYHHRPVTSFAIYDR